MLFLSLDEWRKQQADYFSETNPKIECPTCNGEGTILDDCDCCGHESEAACEDCEESGKVKFNDINEYSRKLVFTKEKYLTVIEEEFIKYAGFTNKLVEELFFNNEFIAYCNIHNREIHLIKRG